MCTYKKIDGARVHLTMIWNKWFKNNANISKHLGVKVKSMFPLMKSAIFNLEVVTDACPQVSTGKILGQRALPR